jgi:hypothetical protein
MEVDILDGEDCGYDYRKVLRFVKPGLASKLGWPFPRSVKHTHNLNFVVAYAIRNYIGRARNNKFARAGDPSGAATSRVMLQKINSASDRLNSANRCQWLVAGNVSSFGFKVC